jgi:isoaspartyl peptidase/L-asparaginase-like protein (Ntn-hydrolase superfamily)
LNHSIPSILSAQPHGLSRAAGDMIAQASSRVGSKPMLGGGVFAASERTDVTTLGVVEKQVDVARHMAEHAQEQCDLSTVMDAMIGPMLHEFS